MRAKNYQILFIYLNRFNMNLFVHKLLLLLSFYLILIQSHIGRDITQWYISIRKLQKAVNINKILEQGKAFIAVGEILLSYEKVMLNIFEESDYKAGCVL
jgi:hypothetical protein